MNLDANRISFAVVLWFVLVYFFFSLKLKSPSCFLVGYLHKYK